jgi:hypothetical protein
MATVPDPFFAEARRRYEQANAGTLRWMLARPTLGDGFVNTKQNSITLADYGPEDGWRGPGFTYGWIQGRALEALVTHGAFFAAEDPSLAEDLPAAADALNGGLARLRDRQGHVSFCYDAAMAPVRPGPDGAPVPEDRPAHIFTYADAFAAKGLLAAAARFAPGDLDRRRADLAAVIAAIEEGRFLMDERGPADDAALAAEADDFGPRMILLGAAGLLARLGLGADAAFADRFIAHVLSRHLDTGSGLLVNVPGEDSCNVGHGIEFVGFALEHLGADADPALVQTLERILIESFGRGFVGPGIALTVSRASGAATSRYCPWWSLPETIRAAALVHERTRSAASLLVWQRADAAFFGRYWRGEPAIAYQTMTAEGPVDFVPATPDLDPGYHTSLSLLGAVEAIDRIGR